MKTFNGIVRRLIEERRASGPRDDLLSMLLAARGAEGGRRMTDRELRDETVTLLLAGHETTANALSWTWYLLALHPELQERVSNEAEAVAHGRPLSAEDLPRLKFAEQVLKESMRLYPPAFIIGREATAAFAAGEYVIPRGATVFLCQWVSHRDSRRFPDPQEFRPERWTTQFEAMLPRYAYFPFGGGLRRQYLRHDRGRAAAFDPGAALALRAGWRRANRPVADRDTAARSADLDAANSKDSIPSCVQRAAAAHHHRDVVTHRGTPKAQCLRVAGRPPACGGFTIRRPAPFRSRSESLP